jgi:hypothetical protein
MPSCRFIFEKMQKRRWKWTIHEYMLPIQVKYRHLYLPGHSQWVWYKIPSDGCSPRGDLPPQNHEDLINLAQLPELAVAVLTLARPPGDPVFSFVIQRED